MVVGRRAAVGGLLRGHVAARDDSPSTGTIGAIAGGIAGLAVLWPWLGASGSLLTRDLVAVAAVPGWAPHLLRGGLRLARDVPGEVLAAGLGQVVGGAWVVRICLVLATVALGAGVGRILIGRATGAVVVAAVAAVANPWLWAHLRQGQWLVVVACAALPWVALGVAADDQLTTARSVVAGATTGFLAVVVVWPTLVVTAVIGGRWRALRAGLGVGVLAALPWLVLPGPAQVDPDGFGAFAANADTPLGVAASLLSGGGYFNVDIASPWRGLVPIALLATLVTVAALVWAARSGLDSSMGDVPRLAIRGLLVSGVIGWAIAVVGATPWGLAALAGVASRVPAVAIVRDTHRLLAPLAVVTAIGLGLLVHDLAMRVGAARREVGWGITAAGLALVAVLVPDPLIGPRLPGPAELPAAWVEASEAIDASGGPGGVLVVPYAQVQRYPFTSGPVAVPWRRMVDRPVLVGSGLVVDDVVVSDGVEDGTLDALASRDPSLWTAAELAASGVAWIVVTDPSVLDERPLAAGLDVVVSDDSLVAIRVAGRVDDGAVDTGGVGGWVFWLDAVVVLGALGLCLPWRLLQRIGDR